MGKEKEDSGIEKLPEGCIAHAIAHTSPLDACRSSAVSTTFRAAADSDLVWHRFLPADTLSILSSALRPFEYSSKRDLFFRLCDSFLIDGGKMSMWLERSTGAKCYMISARELSIVWGDTPQYWQWISLPDSRFSEVAELVNVCWMEIRGCIQSKMLTPQTTYAAYLIFKLADWSRGLDMPPQEASVTVGLRSSTTLVRLQPRRDAVQARRNRIRFGLLRPVEAPAVHTLNNGDEAEEVGERDPPPPTPALARDNGWMEVALGEFYNEKGEDGEVVISFTEIKGGHWKKGLIVQGIEIRPKHRK
ncbi:putative F-box protein PP2-B12 [Zingiber officinale]|uniref:putative F-box protein PP2-B12 n=1 Tax=Zingiber officinale TaxID=94328 RepID=UPI001C4DA146|nr:putative F-box protein PP2-B12 [Zingiber officinale]